MLFALNGASVAVEPRPGETLLETLRVRFGMVPAEPVAETNARRRSVPELDRRGRERIFNLGYFTWVEQQGVSTEEFAARASESFWRDLQRFVPAWDAMIEQVNAEANVAVT